MTDAADNKQSSPKTLPDWATQLFTEFLDHQQDLDRVLHLSMAGIAMLRGRHNAMKVLAEIDGRLEEEKDKLDAAAKERDLAQREVDTGFPILHQQATVALWSSLEALVKSFVARWLEHAPGAWQVDAISRLRVRLGEYESLQPADRCLWVVDLLDQEVSGPLRNGVNRFEALLQPFGLSGAVDEVFAKDLFELSQVRHVLVHRRGLADKRLMDACSWLGVIPGDHLVITHAMWNRYDQAVAEYVLELIQRVRTRFGMPRYEHKEERV